MTVDQVVAYYGTQTRAAKKTGYTQSAFSNWKKRGSISALAQLRIQKKSRRQLKADKGII